MRQCDDQELGRVQTRPTLIFTISARFLPRLCGSSQPMKLQHITKHSLALFSRVRYENSLSTSKWYLSCQSHLCNLSLENDFTSFEGYMLHCCYRNFRDYKPDRPTDEVLTLLGTTAEPSLLGYYNTLLDLSSKCRTTLSHSPPDQTSFQTL